MNRSPTGDPERFTRSVERNTPAVYYDGPQITRDLERTYKTLIPEATAEPETGKPAIEEALHRLGGEIEKLNDLIVTLQSKLYFVMRQERTDRKEKVGAEKNPHTSGFTLVLQEYASAVVDLQLIVSDTLERLEL